MLLTREIIHWCFAQAHLISSHLNSWTVWSTASTITLLLAEEGLVLAGMLDWLRSSLLAYFVPAALKICMFWHHYQEWCNNLSKHDDGVSTEGVSHCGGWTEIVCFPLLASCPAAFFLLIPPFSLFNSLSFPPFPYERISVPSPIIFKLMGGVASRSSI